ncbi:hypothetical protein GQ53DRAFT_743535 [Thozetella sp. PMI_491]|nr:hypothetical protein GQ53DRAFT_743535 [Thozetella sp. PMI_491]
MPLHPGEHPYDPKNRPTFVRSPTARGYYDDGGRTTPQSSPVIASVFVSSQYDRDGSGSP